MKNLFIVLVVLITLNSCVRMQLEGDGIPTTISGDAKVMRIKNPAKFELYHEYHMEFESKTYRELYNGGENE